MSLSDEILENQQEVVHRIMNCSDPVEIIFLFKEYIVHVQKWHQLHVKKKFINDLDLKDFVFRFFLEQSGIADEGFVVGYMTKPTFESVVRVLRLFPPLRKYCEDHFQNGGVIGALKYGESYSVGHDLVIPALKLLESELLP